MDWTSRVPVWLSSLAAATSAALLVVAGCALDKDGSRAREVFNRIGGHGAEGQVIEPKRCVLKVAILDRPIRDPAINEVVWRAADEQVVPPEERRSQEINGLRVGRIIGELPRDLEEILRDESPQKKVTPGTFFVEGGEPALISVGAAVEEVTLLLSRDNKVSGKDYKAASGFLRVIPQHSGAHGVSAARFRAARLGQEMPTARTCRRSLARLSSSM